MISPKNIGYRIKNIAAQEVDILIYDIIGEYINWNTWSIEGVTYKQFEDDFIAALNSSKKINIRINSEGGDVHAGLSIYNLIHRSSSSNIHTYIDGVAYSMAAVISQAVPKGNRHSAKNGLLMIHSASIDIYKNMNASEMRTLADVMDKYDEVLAISIADSMGMSVDDVRSEYFDGADHFFTADEAIAAGLIDDIVDNKSIELDPPAQNSANFLDRFEQRLMSKVSNIFSKITISSKSTIMDLNGIKNILSTDAPLTAEQKQEAISIIDQFNGSKFNEADLSAAVSAKETELNALVAQKDTEIADLKAKIDGITVSSSGTAPVGAKDEATQISKEEVTRAYQPIKFWNK